MTGLPITHFSVGSCQTRRASHSHSSQLFLYSIVHEPDAQHLTGSLRSCMTRLSSGRQFTSCFQWLLSVLFSSSPSESLLIRHHFSTVPPHFYSFASSFFLLVACIISCLLYCIFFLPTPCLLKFLVLFLTALFPPSSCSSSLF